MNFTDPHRQALLEELFPRDGLKRSVALDEAWEVIRRARQVRKRRQQRLVAGGTVLVLAALAMWLSARDSTAPKLGAMRELAVATSVEAQPASQPFQVERLDDEGLLNLLGETPTALVRWPDGTRTLLLVQPSPAG